MRRNPHWRKTFVEFSFEMGPRIVRPCSPHDYIRQQEELFKIRLLSFCRTSSNGKEEDRQLVGDETVNEDADIQLSANNDSAFSSPQVQYSDMISPTGLDSGVSAPSEGSKDDPAEDVAVDFRKDNREAYLSRSRVFFTLKKDISSHFIGKLTHIDDIDGISVFNFVKVRAADRDTKPIENSEERLLSIPQDDIDRLGVFCYATRGIE